MNASGGEMQGSMREHELEVEVARLSAELEALKGDAEPADIAARFLTMAASTVDLAMADARREADELAAEVSAAAEARRDEATRLAEEAEVRAAELRDEAETHEATVEAAKQEAETIKAEAEATVAAERVRVAEEVERLASVRTALETERGALETYHDELKRRVQELAESMVQFMTTEPPIASITAIDGLAAAAIGPSEEAVTAAFAPTEADADDRVETETVTETETETEIDTDPMAVEATDDDAEFPAPGDADLETELPADVDAVADEDAIAVAETNVDEDAIAGAVAEGDMVAEPVDVAPTVEAETETVNPFEPTTVTPASSEIAAPFEAPAADVVEPAPSDDSAMTPPPAPTVEAPSFEMAPPAYEPELVDETPTEAPAGSGGLFASAAASTADGDAEASEPVPSFTEMLAGEAPALTPEFNGVPVVDSAADLPMRRKRGGLFARARSLDGDAAAGSASSATPTNGLFGPQASRLIEQTSSEDLAAALADDSDADARFRSFLDGDDTDASRDWLLDPDA